MRKGLVLLSALAVNAQADRRVLDANLARRLADLEDDNVVSVFVGYRSAAGRNQVKKALATSGISAHHDFDEVNAVAVRLPKKKLKKLAKSSEIDYIEGNSRVYPLQAYSDQVPYGILLSQSSPFDDVLIGLRASPPRCSSDSVTKVAMVDSGVAVNHPDLACYPKNESATNCVGRTFALASSDDHWYDAELAFHGTHVAGTIGALANNFGTVGMIPDRSVCYVFARVFGESGGADFSDVLDAVRWAISSDGGGAKVVNLSLGGADYSQAAENLLQSIYNQGVLIVGAAGNDGGTAYNYPSAYTSVIAVSAVDENMERAYFSQANDRVDIAAPGVSVLSTVPVSPNVAGVITLRVGTSTFVATSMLYGPRLPSAGIAARISVCENGAQDGCSGSSGAVCVIERGDISYNDQAYQCQLGGGVAALIYNNAAGDFEGALDAGTSVSIPTFSVVRRAGPALLDRLGDSLTITETKGYAYLSGTSMAAPHVTGAIASIWRLCPSCTNQNVQDCLFGTALDLGDAGKDDVFGYGLLQTSDARDCLVQLDCCS